MIKRLFFFAVIFYCLNNFGCSNSEKKYIELNKFLSSVKIEELSAAKKIELLNLSVEINNYSRITEILNNIEHNELNLLSPQILKSILKKLTVLKQSRLAGSILSALNLKNAAAQKIIFAELYILSGDFYNFEKYLSFNYDINDEDIDYLIEKYFIYFKTSENQNDLKKICKIFLKYLYASGKKKLAVKLAENLVSIIPDDLTANHILLRFNENKKKLIDDAVSKIENGKSDYYSLLICGLDKLDSEKYDESLIFFNRLIKLSPYSGDIKSIMSEIYFKIAQDKLKQNENPVKITELILKSVMLDGSNINALISLMKIYYNSGIFNEYIKFAEQLFYYNYDDPEEFKKFISVLIHHRKIDKALNFIKKNEPLFTENDELFKIYIQVLELTGNKSKILDLIKIKQLSSGNDKAFYIKFLLLYYKYMRSSEPEDKIKILEEIVFNYNNSISETELKKYVSELSELYYLTKKYMSFIKLFLSFSGMEYNPVYLSNSILNITETGAIIEIINIINARKIKIDLSAYINLLKKSGDYNGIIKYLEDTVKTSKKSDVILSYTDALIKTDRLEEAVPYLKKTLMMTKNNIEALYQIGSIYEKTGDYPLALKYYNDVKRLNPNYENIIMKIVLIDWYKEKYDSVIDKLRVMYISDKTNEILKNKLVECLIDYAVIKDLKNDSQGALNYFNQAYVLSPVNEKLLIKLAEFYLKRKKYKQSLVYYEEFLKRKTDKDVMLIVSDIYKITADYKKMKDLLIEILTIDPENVKAKKKIIDNGYDEIIIEYDSDIRQINSIMSSEKFNPDAIIKNHIELKNKVEETKRMLQFKPRFYEGFLRLGIYYLQLQDFSNALENFEKYHSLINSKESMYYLGFGLSKMNRHLESIKYFKKLYEDYPQWENSYKGLINSYLSNYMISELYEFLNDFFLKNGFKKNPDYFSSVFYEISLYYCKTNNFEAALESLEKAESIFKPSTATQFLKAKIYYIQNRFEDCFKILKDLSLIDKNDYLVFNYMLADYYILKKEFDKAKDIYNLILKIDPKNKIADYNISLISGAAGGLVKNIEGDLKNNYEIYKHFMERDYIKIISLQPVSDYIKYYQALSYYKMNNMKRSLEIFEQIVNFKIQYNSEFYYHYALILNKNNLLDRSADILLKNVISSSGKNKYDAIILLAENYLKLNNNTAALNIISNTDFPPEYESVILNLKGIINFNLKNFDKSADCFEKYLNKKMDNDIFFNLAAAYKELGEYDKSLDICFRLLQKQYYYEYKILTLAGIIYYDLGNFSESESYLKKSIEKKPDQPQARKLLSVIQYRKQ
ncbi:tetratricopeptide repeat protein [Candidatus Dependentiae bacterium]|nr:tetratricopeptide repeat protein [Candidatus Dependentiae bacterium]